MLKKAVEFRSWLRLGFGFCAGISSKKLAFDWLERDSFHRCAQSDSLLYQSAGMLSPPPVWGWEWQSSEEERERGRSDQVSNRSVTLKLASGRKRCWIFFFIFFNFLREEEILQLGILLRPFCWRRGRQTTRKRGEYSGVFSPVVRSRFVINRCRRKLS